MLILTLSANLPFLIIALVAQWSDRSRVMRRITVGSLLTFAVSVAVMGLFAFWAKWSAAAQYLLRTEYQHLQNTNWDLYGLAFFATGILTLMVLVPTARQWLARFIPIVPDSSIHAAALALAVLITGLTCAVWVRTSDQTRLILGDASAGFAGALVINLPGILFALAGVGFLIRRTSKETWERLGLASITPKQMKLVLGLAPVLFAVEYAILLLWNAIEPQGYTLMKDSVAHLLYGGYMSTWQLIAIELTISLAQELFFRGALQPRFGFWLTAIMYTALYVQPSPAATLIILIGALALGWLRDQANTNAGLILHALNIVGGIWLFRLWP